MQMRSLMETQYHNDFVYNDKNSLFYDYRMLHKSGKPHKENEYFLYFIIKFVMIYQTLETWYYTIYLSSNVECHYTSFPLYTCVIL